jgi:hypothetical protein
MNALEQTPEICRKSRACDFTLYAAIEFPDASYDKLRTWADWIQWVCTYISLSSSTNSQSKVFHFDDHFDEDGQYKDDLEGAKENVSDMLFALTQNFGCVQSHKLFGLQEVYSSIWQRFESQASQGMCSTKLIYLFNRLLMFHRHKRKVPPKQFRLLYGNCGASQNDIDSQMEQSGRVL